MHYYIYLTRQELRAKINEIFEGLQFIGNYFETPSEIIESRIGKICGVEENKTNHELDRFKIFV